MEAWYFRPHRWESERLYERLGTRWLSRWVPTGGSEFNRLFFRFTGRRLYTYGRGRTGLEELAALTRQYETIHLGGLPIGLGLTLYEFLTGPHNIPFLGEALLFDVLVLGWPILLQRYNRLRIERVLDSSGRTGPLGMASLNGSQDL